MSTEQSPLLANQPQDGNDSGVVKSPKATPLPALQLFCANFTQFCEPVTATVIFPFIVQLVRDTGITAGNEAKTGYYAGCIESIFYASEALTVVFWGRISDHIGRRPPLVWGTLGTAAAILSFGLSKSFWMLVISRSLLGVFNGNIGISKTFIAEITDSTNIARALSFNPLMWGVGVTIGPAIGGVLSNPAHNWPNSFGKIQFLRDHAYFLPCFAAALIPLSAFLLNLIFLKETLPSAVERKKKQHEEEPSSIIREYPVTPEISIPNKPHSFRELLTRDVVITLVNHAFLAFTENSFCVLLPLVLATEVTYGGVGLDAMTIGIILSVMGIVVASFSMLLLPILARKLGYYRLHRLAFSTSLIVLPAFPVMNLFARRDNYVAVYIVVGCYVASYLMLGLCYSSMFIYITNAAPTPSTLGSINGMAQMVACTARIFAPLTATTLFSLTHQYNVLGGTLVYWIYLVLILGGVYASSKLPKHLKI